MSFKDTLQSDYALVRSELPHVAGILHEFVGWALALIVKRNVLLFILALGAVVGIFVVHGWLAASMVTALTIGVLLVWALVTVVTMFVSMCTVVQ